MTIFDLAQEEAAEQQSRILISATLAGVANALILFLASHAAEQGTEVPLRYFLGFALSICLYVVSARYTYHRISEALEAALHRIKVRVAEKVERADLQGIEQIGSAEIYDRITENVTTISASAGIIANLLQSLSILVFAALYLALLSFSAFLILGIIFGSSIAVYSAKNEEIEGYQRKLAQTRITLFDGLTDLVRGFRDLKYSQRRGSDLRKDLVQTSDSLRKVTVQANRLFDNNWIFANCTLFVALGALVFVLPQHLSIDNALLSKLVAAALFIWGPLGGVVGGFPSYIRSNHALGEIQVLEDKLDAATRDGSAATDSHDPWCGQLTKIEARDLRYEYKQQKGGDAFHIGPLSLTVMAGEIIFIVGGNGSGKSTFLKVLTGLYHPSAGTLRVNDTLVGPGNVVAYRELISAIYSDFHLFAKLYGLLDVDEAAVLRLLSQMQLEGKTGFANQRFTKRDLSTGQRKRLAMIITLLEDRPLCIFDEWAADQDPEFRHYFYAELLPLLKQRGKTVIAVSHDDRYFHYADRVVTMEYGKIRSIETRSTASVRESHDSR